MPPRFTARIRRFKDLRVIPLLRKELCAHRIGQERRHAFLDDAILQRRPQYVIFYLAV